MLPPEREAALTRGGHVSRVRPPGPADAEIPGAALTQESEVGAEASPGTAEPASAAEPGSQPIGSKAFKGKVELLQIFLTFLLIGATSFGGGVVAYLRSGLVLRRRWLDEDEFLEALEISQALPGLNATNMSVIVGDRLRGVRGALCAFFGMTLPGAVMVFVIAAFYVEFRDNPHVNSVLTGVGAASVGLLTAVTLQIGHKQLAKWKDIAVVLATVVLIGILHVSLVIVLLTVGPLTVFLYRPRPDEPSGPVSSGPEQKRAD